MKRWKRKGLIWLLALLVVVAMGFTVKQNFQFNKGGNEDYALRPEDARAKNGIIIFCYHRILKNTAGVQLSKILSSNSQLHDFDVPLDQFAAQMKTLHEQHVKVISSAQMAQMKASGKPIKGKYVVLTFDDIDRTTIDNAMPIMKKYHMPFTTFVITGNTGRYREGTQLATWSQIKAAKKSAGSLMTLGLHTHDMHYLTKKFTPIFDQPHEYQNFKRDFALSKRELKAHMGVTAKMFAYPYGSGPKRINNFLSKQHLTEGIATLDVGIVTDETAMNNLPRMIVNGNSWPSIKKWLTQN
ncbi:polysaccharide deacetylase [Lactobacillus kunkeei] [Lactiplantibacillus mudanjiangensis]|uniref:polysaccharide deacetylase family protein n=1 Tax=Lactiplantibacillus mudanjiangensis TaxID=1296538 RepID=UPI0010153192|nr:polysaccharide deacetylase [Lactobacillus kunkeei] [Lactiplantibacillus mudanjiangensis]